MAKFKVRENVRLAPHLLELCRTKEHFEITSQFKYDCADIMHRDILDSNGVGEIAEVREDSVRVMFSSPRCYRSWIFAETELYSANICKENILGNFPKKEEV